MRNTSTNSLFYFFSDKAPSLKKFAGDHLEADDYHKAMMDPEAVIIDVRNAYESAIGHFQPPEGGAKLIDPKMRNSIEFPKWLNEKETQKQLTGKKVLMYCTGGIRCERATALLNQMSTVNEELKPQGVYHCRGGIERYVKTFPSGGFWKGSNYLFDKRMEQTPVSAAEKTIDSKCCLCRSRYTVYRNQFKCSRSLCGVPVIVCNSCTTLATDKPGKLMCELCREGYKAPSELPDLVAMKRKAEALTSSEQQSDAKQLKACAERQSRGNHEDRIFLRRLPLTVTFTKIKELLGGTDKVKNLAWLVDKESGAFYGSCIVLLSSPSDVEDILDRRSPLKLDKKNIKVARVFRKDNEDRNLFQASAPSEYPPIGTVGPMQR